MAITEPLAASVDAPLGVIHEDQPVSEVRQITGASPEARSDLEHRPRRQVCMEPGEQRSPPEIVRVAPLLGPLFAACAPVVRIPELGRFDESTGACATE